MAAPHPDPLPVSAGHGERGFARQPLTSLSVRGHPIRVPSIVRPAERIEVAGGADEGRVASSQRTAQPVQINSSVLAEERPLCRDERRDPAQKAPEGHDPECFARILRWVPHNARPVASRLRDDGKRN